LLHYGIFDCKMKKATRVTQVLYSGLGGHGSVAFSIIDGDKNKSTQHSLLFFGIEPVKEAYLDRCIQDRMPFKSIRYGQRPFFIDWLLALYFILRQHPQVVLLHSMTLAFIVPFLRIAGIRVIAIDHTPNSTKRKLEWWSLRTALIFCQQVVYLTESHRQEVEQRLGTSRKTVIINNGINTQVYHPCPAPVAPPFTIMMQARFSPTKDFQTLIKAAALLKKRCDIPFTVRLAGDGETKAACEELVRSLEAEAYIRFEGMLNEQQVITLLAETHLYVHATLSEAMSTSVMQALACGKPTLAANVAGMDYLIQHEQTGLLFPVGDAAHLADDLHKCLEGQVNIAVLGKNAREFAEKKLSMERMFRGYQQIMQPHIKAATTS
jgi:glycosyltransferase involved in cell wall biosynthesis